MWVRGLKLLNRLYLPVMPMSHPMWVRGLKHIISKENEKVTYVAPHVGAWIETLASV